VVGNGTRGFIDGVPATAAEISLSRYVYIDSAGNLYLSEQNNQRVRIVNTAGIISTIAGTGALGFTGEGTAATLATMNLPTGVVADRAGIVYFSDLNNYRIRRIDHSGTITTIAGTGTPGFSGDGGAATLAKFNQVEGICMDGAGNLYLADYGGGHIRKINPATGIIISVAGNLSIFGGDGGPATAAGINPEDIAIDKIGNMYIADHNYNRIRKVDTAGIITTIAGNGTAGYIADGIAATASELNAPSGVAVDGCGNVYIADDGNSRVRKVDVAGIITTIAGNGTTAYGGDGGPATAGLLWSPWGVKTDKKGNIFIADFGNYRIRKVSSTNRPPYFTGGHSQSFTICSDSVFSVNSFLDVIDTDLNQGETWSVWAAPAHGTLMAAYSTISTGGKLTPTGLSYIASGGYTGLDSFKVIVSDCADLHDTTTVYVTVKSCPLFVQAFSHSSIEIYPNPNSGAFSMYIPSTANGEAHVIISNLMGEKVKELTTATNKMMAIQLDSPPGMYFCNVTTKEGNYIARVLVIR
jgi:hypothetical protein